MLLKGAYCVGEHFVDPHSMLNATKENMSVSEVYDTTR